MNRIVYVFLSEGFEEIEALATVDLLRRAGLNVITVSTEEGLRVCGGHNIQVDADKQIAHIDPSVAVGIVLPGGSRRLGESALLVDMLNKYNQEGKLIAAICAAPSILGDLGLLQGRKATSYPGFEHYLKGANVIDTPVVVDGHIITSQAPSTSIDFALAIINYLLGEEVVQQIRQQIVYRK